MRRDLIIVAAVVALIAGAFFYIRSSERAKVNNANTTRTIEGIRDARTIENDTRDTDDDGLRGILTDGVR
jgi:hypothetical protein